VPYQLAPAAPLARELRRVAREQTEAALAQLDGDPDSGTVHDARKRVKKLRSVLRLARDPLGKRVYSQHQRTLRDAGRRLSAIRDADVLVRAAERLQEHVAPNGRDALAALQQRLVLERDSLRTHSLHASVEAGRTMLATLHGGIEEWRLGRVGRQDVLDAFGREYRNGRRAFAAATTSRQDERLHEWRKRVKDLWHLVRLFSNLWPPVFKCWAEETHRLADLLGDDLDLAVLRALCTRQRERSRAATGRCARRSTRGDASCSRRPSSLVTASTRNQNGTSNPACRPIGPHRAVKAHVQPIDRPPVTAPRKLRNDQAAYSLPESPSKENGHRSRRSRSMMLNTAIVARTRKTAAEASRKVSTGPSTIHWRPTAKVSTGFRRETQ
jgi:CHAD domain-containing protein